MSRSWRGRRTSVPLSRLSHGLMILCRWLRDILRFMTGQNATQFKGQVSEELMRQLVFATNAKVQEEFKRQHGEMIERAVKGLTAAHDALDLLRQRLRGKGDLQV